MPEKYINEPLLDMFIFESTQLIEQLEQLILNSEKSGCFLQPDINEIFRIMHTIKGSSAMMMFENLSLLSHSIEDLFYYIREDKPQNMDFSKLSDLILEGVDFIKVEIEKIKNGNSNDGNAFVLIDNIKSYLSDLKQLNNSADSTKNIEFISNERQQFYISPAKLITSSPQNAFKAVIYFDDGCQMENVRAYSIIHNLKKLTEEVYYIPEDIIDNDNSSDVIRKEGFQIFLKIDYSYEKIKKFFMDTLFLRELELNQLEDEDDLKHFIKIKQVCNDRQISLNPLNKKDTQSVSTQQNIISVNVLKLDKLMDLVGEMVIAEAMVIRNPDLKGLELSNFSKAARQLHKITGEMQDIVMQIRMMPIAATFHKMHRIVRDMGKKLDKEVELKLIGEETEVDKNIIEHISDPLMHLIRNSIDHGLEGLEERIASGKAQTGTITLEAKNAGSDVIISVNDDGKGLNKDKILQKARENNLLNKNESEIGDKEIYNLILLPGFSTKDTVSEFSGRGVGMDVVIKNIEAVGGTILVDSSERVGTTISMKIPLTLAIIDGMNIKVGNSYYTIPTTSIKESFRPRQDEIIIDPDCNEMIMVRGKCYPILRLHKYYDVITNITEISKGILIMVEQEQKNFCIFADELLGQQQVVVKSLPNYIKSTRKISGLTGCTLLGDGSISLILDVGGLFNLNQ